MIVHTSRWYITAILLFVSAVLAGIAVVSALEPFKNGWGTVGLSLSPFVIVATVAAGASKLGRIVGYCTWLGGLLCVGPLYLMGYMGYQQGIQQHAWTGASLAMFFAILAAFPASIVGSLVGLMVGRAVSKSGTKSDKNPIGKKAARN
jgi:hypothetical protein